MPVHYLVLVISFDQVGVLMLPSVKYYLVYPVGTLKYFEIFADYNIFLLKYYLFELFDHGRA